jgi:acyl-CoA dehydrogenase
VRVARRGFMSKALPVRPLGFELTEEQLALQEVARKGTQEFIVPAARHHDETGEYPWEPLRGLHGMGLLNLHVPQQCGGLGLSSVDASLVTEELAWGCTGIQTAAEANGLAQAPLVLAANDEQMKKYLAPMTEELRMAAYCVTEPGAGSDVSGIKTTAKVRQAEIFQKKKKKKKKKSKELISRVLCISHFSL